jgi:tRNA pseudouridine55 synthase
LTSNGSTRAPASADAAVAVIDKPAGMTSHDVVDHVRRKMDTKKVGHAGTLDPDATGVLVIGVGRATRLLRYAQMGDKRYLATASFGSTTSTQDASGEVLETNEVRFTQPELEEVLKDFTGDIEQIPPMVSAVKVGGERLYKKARRGEEVERAPRRVTIGALQLLELKLDTPHGVLATLDITCSGGTYIRTLVHDIGQRLGCGAHLSELRRTASGPFSEDQAVPLSEIDPGRLRPMREAVALLPSLSVDGDRARAVVHGRPLDIDAGEDFADRVAVISDEELLAVYRREGNKLIAETVVGQ